MGIDPVLRRGGESLRSGTLGVQTSAHGASYARDSIASQSYASDGLPLTESFRQVPVDCGDIKWPDMIGRAPAGCRHHPTSAHPNQDP